MRLCIADPSASSGAVVYAADAVTCASLGYANYVGTTSGYPDLSIAEIDSLMVASMLLWATVFGLRLLRGLLPYK